MNGRLFWQVVAAFVIFAVTLVVALMLIFGTSTTGSSVPATPAPAAKPTGTIHQWDDNSTAITFSQVAPSPNRYRGDRVTWTCNVANIFGKDTSDGRTNIGCWEYAGTYDGQNGNGEIFLSVPSSVNVDQVVQGDDLAVRGVLAGQYLTDPPRPAYSGPIVDVVFLKDNGHDPKAT
jgi:hypothetical protein